MFSRTPLTPDEVFRLLSVRRLPGRLPQAETAVLLGFSEQDVTTLVGSKLIEPLGQPVPNAPKYFSASDVNERVNNRAWLVKATRTVTNHWRSKNLRKCKRSTKDT